MHIEYLKYFHDVASMGSISKVANTCHISQPALSQQIQKLEDVLGYKLLTRSNKGVELTEAGQVVEKYSKTLIKSYDNMLEDLIAMSKSNNTIRIDSSPTIAAYALPCTIYKLKEDFPEYKVNLTTNYSEDVENNIINDFCDFGFILGRPSEENELSYFKVGADRLVAVVSHDFEIKSQLYLRDIFDYKLIMLQDKFRVTQEIKKQFQSTGLELKDESILFSLDSIESVKSTVIKGYGLSFLPYIAIKKELYTKQLKEVNIPDFNADYEIYLVYKKGKDMGGCVKKCIAYYKKIGEKNFC